MIVQKIMLITLLVINILLLMSLVTYIGLKIYIWKHEDDIPTKEEWKLMQ